MNKIPPQAIDVEKTVLGSALINNKACEMMMELIETEDFFYSTSHKLIYNAILELTKASTEVDILTLTEQLKKNNSLNNCGGEAYISELVDDVDTVTNIIAHVKILREKCLLRSWITLAADINTNAYNPDGVHGNIEAMVEKRILGFTTHEKIETQHVNKIIGGVFEDMENARKGKATGLTTGFKDIDEKTGGMYPGDLVILAARPSMGKSALMNNLCENCWDMAQKPVLIISLEMSKKALVRRMLASGSGVSGSLLRRGNINKGHFDELSKAAGELYNKGLYINDDPYLNVYQIRTIALRLHRKYDFGLVAVDYLQKIRDTGKQKEKRHETGEKSAVLKALAKEMDVPVLCLAQLSRACESRPNKRPILSDLRESGDIEQDADVVSFIYRPFMGGEDVDESVAEFIIAKQREGEIGTVKLEFDGPTTSFKDTDQEIEQGYKF